MGEHGGKILIVDDELKIVEIIKAYFEAGGFQTETAYTGSEALRKFEEKPISLIVLDLMLPDISGERVCEIIRRQSDVPIIMLTAKLQEESFLNGLKIGADDYMTKPFSPKQLVAKAEAILRRVRSRRALLSKIEIVSVGDIEIDDAAHEVRKNGELVDLTPNEYNILLSMIRYPYKTFTREELVFIALGKDYSGYDRMVDTYMKQLRRKIEDQPKNPEYIITVHGIGYKFGKE